MMGTAPGFVPATLDRSVIDEIKLVSEAEAFEMCRRIAAEVGVLVGISAGAAAFAAQRIANDNPEQIVVSTFCDSGERYLSVDGLFI
jgi:cysteine synthase A